MSDLARAPEQLIQKNFISRNSIGSYEFFSEVKGEDYLSLKAQPSWTEAVDISIPRSITWIRLDRENSALSSFHFEP
jgi:hypothetical protein